MIIILIEFSSKKIEDVCTNEKKMKSFFKNEKGLIEGLEVLISLLDNIDSIYEFWKNELYKGYNLEKIKNTSGLFSIRIIPKKKKYKERMILISMNDNGSKIQIIDIIDHNYEKALRK